jgi:hypothetical protein
MAYSDSDELLAAALAQLAREQGDPSLVAHSMVDPSGSYIPYTDTEEPHDFTPVGSGSLRDAYSPGLHESGAKERGERLDDSNMIRYSTEDAIQDEVSNALYDELFRMARGKSEFSNEALDKKKQMTDYLNNDQRLIESLIRRGKIKA